MTSKPPSFMSVFAKLGIAAAIVFPGAYALDRYIESPAPILLPKDHKRSTTSKLKRESDPTKRCLGLNRPFLHRRLEERGEYFSKDRKNGVYHTTHLHLQYKGEDLYSTGRGWKFQSNISSLGGKVTVRQAFYHYDYRNLEAMKASGKSPKSTMDLIIELYFSREGKPNQFDRIQGRFPQFSDCSLGKISDLSYETGSRGFVTKFIQHEYNGQTLQSNQKPEFEKLLRDVFRSTLSSELRHASIKR